MTSIGSTTKRLFEAQIHRVGLAVALAPLGFRLRDSVKLVALALLEPLRARSPWRDRPVSISIAIDGSPATFKTVGRTDLEVAREIFVNDEYQLPGSARVSTILDLGAHIGLASIHLAKLFPNARIVAVEADPELVETLRENVRSLPVEVIHAAVSAESGSRSFFRSADTWANSVERTREFQEEIAVPALTMEDILDRTGIDHVSLMKFDIEGSEWELFEDGLPDYVDAAIGEVHARPQRNPKAIVDAVAETRCVSMRRTNESSAVFFAASRCSTLREPLLGFTGYFSTVI